MDQRHIGIAIIGDERRKRAKAFGTEPLIWSLPGFPVKALVGNLLQPLPNLRVDIGKIREGAQRPKVFPKVSNAAFNFAFFPTRCFVAGSRIKIHLTGKRQKPRIESNNPAIMFRDGGDQIVIETFPGPAAHELKSMDMTADEGLKALAVGKLDIEPAAMAFNAAEGIELALVSLIVDGAKMSPVDLESSLRGWIQYAHKHVEESGSDAKWLRIPAG